MMVGTGGGGVDWGWKMIKPLSGPQEKEQTNELLRRWGVEEKRTGWGEKKLQKVITPGSDQLS